MYLFVVVVVNGGDNKAEKVSDSSKEGERGNGDVLLVLVVEGFREVGGGAVNVLLGAVNILGTFVGFILAKKKEC